MRLARAIDRLNTAVAAVVYWSLLANALLIAGNALARKLLVVSWPVIYDLQWHFMAAVVLLMAAYTFKRDEHVRVDVLAHRLGERGLAWLDLIGIVSVLLPICILMVWFTTPPFLEAIASGETRINRESLSTLPTAIIKGLVPAGFLLLALQGVAEGIRCIAALRGLVARPIHRRRLVEGSTDEH